MSMITLPIEMPYSRVKLNVEDCILYKGDKFRPETDQPVFTGPIGQLPRPVLQWLADLSFVVPAK